MDKFVTPCELPNDHERESLVIMIEEGSEVIQQLNGMIDQITSMQLRASKMIRFGIEEVQPDQPLSNKERLSEEIGDLQALFELGTEIGIIDTNVVSDAKLAKRKKLYKYMQTTNEDT